MPSFKAGDGVGIGAPRTALEATKVEESTIGKDFVRADGIAGLRDADGRTVESLWAGDV